VLFMAALAFTLLSRLMIRHEGPDSRLAKAFGRDIKGAVSLLLYAVGVAAAFFQPLVSLALYVAVAAIWFVPDTRIERVTRD